MSSPFNIKPRRPIEMQAYLTHGHWPDANAKTITPVKRIYSKRTAITAEYLWELNIVRLWAVLTRSDQQRKEDCNRLANTCDRRINIIRLAKIQTNPPLPQLGWPARFESETCQPFYVVKTDQKSGPRRTNPAGQTSALI